MKKTSISLTDSEHTALAALAEKNNVTLGTLLRVAATKLAEKMGGAAPRAEGVVSVTVDLWPMDIPALQDYTVANEHPSRANAVRAAMRVGLIERGFLTMPRGSVPDMGVRQ